MRKVITLNGRDGIGKTEQARLLCGQPELHVTRALKQYGDTWPKLNSTDEFDWWFKNADFYGFIDVITNSLNERHRDKSTGNISVHERGTLMFLAVCMAVFATRLKTSVSGVHKEVQERFLSRIDYQPDAELNILLTEDAAYKDRIEKMESPFLTGTSSHTPEQQVIYGRYQENLKAALDICLGTGTTVIPVDQCIVDIQNEIRKAISSLAGIELESLCENIESLICLGGMSESGKSMLGQNLHVHHGSYRLKLKYFAGAFGDDLTLAQEVLRFLHMHRHISLASVESLHNAGLPIVFKKMLGRRVKTVFLDAPQEERARRHMLSSQATMEEFFKKEALKESRGAPKVRSLADIVINTALCTPEETCSKVLQIVV